MDDLIGKTIRIVVSENKTLIGKEGVVVDETKHMLSVETSHGRKQIPKNTVRFCVLDKNKEKIIDGKKITKRMYDRIKG